MACEKCIPSTAITPPRERRGGCLSAIGAAVAAVLYYYLFVGVLLPLVAGCAGMGDGAKVVEGTDLTFGVQFPYTDCETMAMVNYLTGFRVTVAENARCKVKYTSAETNSYFGLIETRVAKTIDATVEPTVDPEDDSEDCAPPEQAAKDAKPTKGDDSGG
jgi:hypothetical protein